MREFTEVYIVLAYENVMNLHKLSESSYVRAHTKLIENAMRVRGRWIRMHTLVKGHRNGCMLEIDRELIPVGDTRDGALPVATTLQFVSPEIPLI